MEEETHNLNPGNVVLIRHLSEHRNNRPDGTVERLFRNEDDSVRKVEVRTIRNGKHVLH